MELLAELVVFVVMEVILAGIGWLCLFVWFRNRQKMEEIRNKKYAGRYSAVGGVMILNLIAGIGAITMFGIVISFLGYWIYQAIV